MALAMITGKLLLTQPYRNHIKVPNANREYITNEIPEVFLVLIVLIACGINDNVVKNAAIIPIIISLFIVQIHL